jgi:hypothetical protein
VAIVSVLHINRGPGPVIVTKRENIGERFCFCCRKRVEFEQLAMKYDCDPMDDYYGPWGAIKCVSRGHADGDLFPGRFRVWGAE